MHQSALHHNIQRSNEVCEMFSHLTTENKVLLKNLPMQLKTSEGFVLFLFLNKFTNLYVFWSEVCWLFLTLLYNYATC